MSDFLRGIRELIDSGDVRISEHGYDRLAEENIFSRDLIANIFKAEIVEEYPDYPKGHCILLLQRDRDGNPVHAVWGIAKGYNKPVVLITAYRPDSQRWDSNFLQRQSL